MLTPEEAAGFLTVTTKTLGANHVDWGLDKSIAFGVTNPRYLLSQIVERLKAKMIKGKKPKTEVKMEGSHAA